MVAPRDQPVDEARRRAGEEQHRGDAALQRQGLAVEEEYAFTMHGAALAIISACVPEPASMLHRTLALALLFAPTIAEAQLCEGQSAAIAPDGRAFGHLREG